MKTGGTDHPDYRLTLCPQYDDKNAVVSHFRAEVRLGKLPAAITAGEVICRTLKWYANVPTYDYDASTVRARDVNGPLSVSISSTGGEDKGTAASEWAFDRDSSGDVIFDLDVYARNVDFTTLLGPKVDMRLDQGGLVTGGYWFLPRPIIAPRFNFHVNWDLSQCPPDTKAIWSFGDASRSWTDEGPYEMFANCVFMVGKINTFIPTLSSGEPSPKCSIHWLGDLPDWILKPANLHGDLWKYALKLFHGEYNRYRVFIRRGPRGFGGSSFNSSYVLEHSLSNEPKSDSDLVAFFTHEMMHNWLLLGPDGETENTWFIEGIANFYALFLPTRAGIRGSEYFKEILDSYLCSYFTNPLVEMDLSDAGKLFWKDSNAASIPYIRGALYLLLVECSLRKSPAFQETSHEVNCLDTIVNSLVSGKLWKGEMTSSKSWLEELYPYIGKEEVDKQFNALTRGTILDLEGLIVPVPCGGRLRLKRVDHEVLEPGFDLRASLTSRMIKGVIPGSRAQLAGLQDGDAILNCSSLSLFVENTDSSFRCLVKKETGETVEYTFRPRSFKKVPSLVSEVAE